MLIRQEEQEFEPIVIKLETAAEANILWDILKNYGTGSIETMRFIKATSDWFSNKAKF